MTATTIARMRVGSSPMPHATAPPRCWSAMALGPHSRPRRPNHSGTSSSSPDVSATPKNAWNAMVANSRSRRCG
ncbi:Uncharacterised protein [Mycobacteroides abscessus]|nr:Uncharacterised protein [Mycobacteroides abscessus]